MIQTYHTIKSIQELAERNKVKILGVTQENKFVVIVLDNGVRIKFLNF